MEFREAITNKIDFELNLVDNISSALGNVTLFYFLEKARKMAQDFEAQMVNANSIFLESMENYSKLTSKILNLGGETSKSLNDIAKSLYNLASAGLETNQAFEVLKNSLQFAEATGDDIDQITEAVAKFSRSFKINFNESGEVVKQFANLINKTQIKFKDIMSSMKFATQIGALFPKQELSDVLTALGLLVNRGIPASTALRQLRSVMIDLTRDTGKLNTFLQKYGLTLKEITPETHSISEIIAKFNKLGVSSSDIMKLFGKRASGAFKILMDEGVPAYQKLKTEIEGLNTLEKQREVQLESLDRKEKQFYSMLQSFGVRASQLRNEWLKGFYDVGLAVGKLMKDMPALKQSIASVAEVFAVILSVKAIKSLGLVALNMMKINEATTILGVTVGTLASVFQTMFITLGAGIAVYRLAEYWNQKYVDSLNQEANLADKLAVKWREIQEIYKTGVKTQNETLILQSKIMALETRIANIRKLYADNRAKITKQEKENLTHTIMGLQKERSLLKEKYDHLKKIQGLIAKGNAFYKEQIKTINDYTNKISKYQSAIKQINEAVKEGSVSQEIATKAIIGYNQQIEELTKEKMPMFVDFIHQINDILEEYGTNLSEIADSSKEYFGDVGEIVADVIDEFIDLGKSTDTLGDKMHKLSVRAQQEQIFLKYKQGAISAKEAIYQMAKVAVESSNWMENAMIDYANKLADAVDTRRISAFNSKLDETIMQHDSLISLAQKLGLTYEEAEKFADGFLNKANQAVEASKKVLDNMNKANSSFGDTSQSGGYNFHGDVSIDEFGHRTVYNGTMEDVSHMGIGDTVILAGSGSGIPSKGEDVYQALPTAYGWDYYKNGKRITQAEYDRALNIHRSFWGSDVYSGLDNSIGFWHLGKSTAGLTFTKDYSPTTEGLTFSSNDPFTQLQELNAYGYKYGFTTDLLALKKKIEENIAIYYQKEMMRDLDPKKAQILDLEAKYQTYKKYDPEMAEKWYQAQRQQIEESNIGLGETAWQEELLPLAVGSNLGATPPTTFSHITTTSPTYNKITGYTPTSYTSATTKLSTTPMGSYTMYYGGTVATNEGYKGVINFKNIDDRIFEILDRYQAHYKKRIDNGQLIGVNVFFNKGSKGEEIIKAIKNLYGSNNVKTTFNK